MSRIRGVVYTVSFQDLFLVTAEVMEESHAYFNPELKGKSMEEWIHLKKKKDKNTD